MRFRALVLSAVLLLSTAVPAFAQVTGSISGVVFDGTGKVVAGRRSAADQRCHARRTLDRLVGVGPVHVPAAAAGQLYDRGREDRRRQDGPDGRRRRSAATTQVDVILGKQVVEDVTVSATSPRIDLKSTEVSFNFKREFIQDLPLDRSYLGLLQLDPGRRRQRRLRAERRRQPAGQHLPASTA